METEPEKITPTETPEAVLERKRAEAKRALEGPEWTEKRERSEREKEHQTEKVALESEQVKIVKDKEKLELDWVALDDQRKIINQALAPILERERLAETEEARLEIEEVKTGVPQAKQGIEHERWTAQDKRRRAEEEKWGLQEKLFKLEQAIETNTQKYRALLDQEEVIQAKLNTLSVIQ